MNSFKIKILSTSSVIILAIVFILATISYSAFRTVSIAMNKSLRYEQNNTVKVSISEKINSYKSMLLSVEATQADILDDRVSDQLQVQLETLLRAQEPASEGFALFTESGDIYHSLGNKLPFNVRDLGRSYYKALFRDDKNFFVSAPYESAVSGNTVIAIAEKLNNSLAVVTNVSLSSMLDDLAERKR